MSEIKSKMITGISASEITNRRIVRDAGLTMLKVGTKIAYTVMKSKLDNKTYYCCLSGGSIVNGEPNFTQIGLAAFETLMALPVGNECDVVIQEVKICETPLSQKIKSTLRKLPNNSKICFIGDMAGELDGVLINIFNPSGTTEV